MAEERRKGEDIIEISKNPEQDLEFYSFEGRYYWRILSNSFDTLEAAAINAGEVFSNFFILLDKEKENGI